MPSFGISPVLRAGYVQGERTAGGESDLLRGQQGKSVEGRRKPDADVRCFRLRKTNRTHKTCRSRGRSISKGGGSERRQQLVDAQPGSRRGSRLPLKESYRRNL